MEKTCNQLVLEVGIVRFSLEKRSLMNSIKRLIVAVFFNSSNMCAAIVSTGPLLREQLACGWRLLRNTMGTTVIFAHHRLHVNGQS